MAALKLDTNPQIPISSKECFLWTITGKFTYYHSVNPTVLGGRLYGTYNGARALSGKNVIP